VGPTTSVRHHPAAGNKLLDRPSTDSSKTPWARHQYPAVLGIIMSVLTAQNKLARLVVEIHQFRHSRVRREDKLSRIPPRVVPTTTVRQQPAASNKIFGSSILDSRSLTDNNNNSGKTPRAHQYPAMEIIKAV
jgi:hypothetical protein